MSAENIVTEEKLNHYIDLTKRARAKATPIHEEGTEEAEKLAIMMRMADDYASDAQHFLKIGDHVRAFGAINYAHAWIDAGVKLGLLDGHGDDDRRCHGSGPPFARHAAYRRAPFAPRYRFRACRRRA